MHFDTEAQRQKTLNTVHKRKEKSQEHFTTTQHNTKRILLTKLIKSSIFALDEKSLTGGKYLKNEINIVKISKILNNIVAR